MSRCAPGQCPSGRCALACGDPVRPAESKMVGRGSQSESGQQELSNANWDVRPSDLLGGAVEKKENKAKWKSTRSHAAKPHPEE